jgi:hypothetical protein
VLAGRIVMLLGTPAIPRSGQDVSHGNRRRQVKPCFDRLDAPVKSFYTFKQSAHTPHFEEPERTREILRADGLAGSTGLADSQ